MNPHKARLKRECRRTRRNRVSITLESGRTVTVEGKGADEMKESLDQLAVIFREKFGRDPGPDDPIFFDPAAETPQPIAEERILTDMVAAMRRAEIPEEKIYAYEKTGGLLLTTSNEDRVPPEDREEWYAAVDEYRQLHPK